MKSSSQARRHLDPRLERLRSMVDEPRPPRGWIRAIREALGMSTTELASRMGISQSGIPELERSEVSGSLKLARLRRAAEALDCELVYALVPRTSLEQSVDAQARRKATRRLAGIGHSMSLENQPVDEADTDHLLGELAAGLVDKRGLWTETPLIEREAPSGGA